jgi:Flp pilus assembly protein TadB
MDERIEVEVQGTPRRRGGLHVGLMVPGLACIALGVLVIVVPQLITAMVAAFFFAIGLGLLVAASKVRRAQARFRAFRDDLGGRW